MNDSRPIYGQLREIYPRAQSPSGAPGSPPMVATLFVLTVATGIGIVGATTGMWLPVIRTVLLYLLF
jgi:hypothetical protein